MTDATQKGREKPVAIANGAAIGVIRVMVPTEVPMASETKQLTTKRMTTDPNATVTTTAVRYGIYAFSIYIPLAMMVALLLLTSRFDIENRYTEILRTIQARKKTQSPHA